MQENLINILVKLHMHKQVVTFMWEHDEVQLKKEIVERKSGSHDKVK